MLRFISLGLLALSFSAQAALKIEITGGVENAYPIAVVPFEEKGGKSPELMDKIVSNDLFVSGRFKTLSTIEMPQQPVLPSQVDFKAWQVKGTESLVIGQIEKLADGRFRIDARLINVFSKEQVWGQRWEVPAVNLRKVAHKISDKVIEGRVKSISRSKSCVTCVKSSTRATFKRPCPANSPASAPTRLEPGLTVAAPKRVCALATTASISTFPIRPAAPAIAIRIIGLAICF
jgi:TolB-like protein